MDRKQLEEGITNVLRQFHEDAELSLLDASELTMKLVDLYFPRPTLKWEVFTSQKTKRRIWRSSFMGLIFCLSERSDGKVKDAGTNLTHDTIEEAQGACQKRLEETIKLEFAGK